jgi:hypothetical protein
MDENEPREPYQPPVIEDVPLRTEEQVLAGCKGPGHSGPGASFFCEGLRGPCVSIRPS